MVYGHDLWTWHWHWQMDSATSVASMYVGICRQITEDNTKRIAGSVEETRYGLGRVHRAGPRGAVAAQ